MIDYHIHTSRCGHARGSIEDYVEASISRGLREIGFSDHFPMDVLGFSSEAICSMSFDELEEYLQDIEKIKRKFGERINIRKGIEMDYQQELEEKIELYASDDRWDFVIGSVHFLDGYDFSKPGQEEFFNDKSIDELYLKYFEEVKKLIKSGLFDVVAHIDLIKKFGCRPQNLDMREIYEEIADLISSTNMTVEINTAGLRHPVKEMYPSFSFLKELASREVPVTFGSDAHKPKDVAYSFPEVKKELKEKIGAMKVNGFYNRSPVLQEEI